MGREETLGLDKRRIHLGALTKSGRNPGHGRLRGKGNFRWAARDPEEVIRISLVVLSLRVRAPMYRIHASYFPSKPPVTGVDFFANRFGFGF